MHSKQPKKRYLIVADDNRDAAELTAFMLTSHLKGMFGDEYDVETRVFTRGSDAWAYFGNLPEGDARRAVLVTDACMPGLSGDELLNNLRGSKRTAFNEMPVIYLSGVEKSLPKRPKQFQLIKTKDDEMEDGQPSKLMETFVDAIAMVDSALEQDKETQRQLQRKADAQNLGVSARIDAGRAFIELKTKEYESLSPFEKAEMARRNGGLRIHHDDDAAFLDDQKKQHGLVRVKDRTPASRADWDEDRAYLEHLKAQDERRLTERSLAPTSSSDDIKELIRQEMGDCGHDSGLSEVQLRAIRERETARLIREGDHARVPENPRKERKWTQEEDARRTSSSDPHQRLG